MSREVGFQRASPGDRRARRAPLGLARRSAPGIAAVLLAAASACERRESAGEEPPARSWPPGTVLAIDGEPILAEEVDLPSAWIERIEPGSSSQHLRRLSLTNVVIPRRIAGAIAGDEARERARAEAAATLESLVSAPREAPATAGEPASAEGDWLELGIVAWGTAMDLAEGSWSGVVEDVGRFVVLRRVGQDPAPVPGAIRVRLELLEFPYLAGVGRGALEQTYARHRLEIVDPAWREIVPEHIQYKMGVHQP